MLVTGSKHSAIACVIVNYFNAELTARAVRSVLNDLSTADVVVVDNSTDSKQTQQLKQCLDPRATLLSGTTNVGFGAACNIGLTATKAPLVMLLNPDAMVTHGCLQQLAATLIQDTTLGAVSPLQWWEPSGQWLLPPAWLPTGIGMWCLEQAWRNANSAQRLTMAYRRLALTTWNTTGQQQFIQQRALSGGAMMVRRDAVIEAGGLFDPDYFMYYEDSDLCLRLRQHGWQLGTVPLAVVVHEWEHSSAKIDMMERAKSIYLNKHFHGRGAWESRLMRTLTQSPSPTPFRYHNIQFPKVEALPIPKNCQNNWLLEISPSPLMIPSLGALGKESLAKLPKNLFLKFGSNVIYARIGPAQVDSNWESTLTYRITPND